ncbi:MAG: YkvA family protein [Bacteroidota bacterium]
MKSENINNRFFKRAKEKATAILKSNDRLKRLILAAGEKIARVGKEGLKTDKLVNKVKIIMRMMKAYLNGTYRAIPWKSMIILAAALVYFVNPMDLIPDFVPVSGFIDDFSIMLWVFNNFQKEIDAYVAWERQFVE